MNRLCLAMIAGYFVSMFLPQSKPDLGPPATPPPATAKTPVVSDADQTKIRKMQLDDARISNAIQQRQLEIVDLQQRRDRNAEEFQKFVAGVCGKDFVFSQDRDVLVCVEKPKEKK